MPHHSTCQKLWLRNSLLPVFQLEPSKSQTHSHSCPFLLLSWILYRVLKSFLDLPPTSPSFNITHSKSFTIFPSASCSIPSPASGQRPTTLSNGDQFLSYVHRSLYPSAAVLTAGRLFTVCTQHVWYQIQERAMVDGRRRAPA